LQIGIKLSQGRLLTRCILFADNDPKLSYKLQLQSYPTSAPYQLGRQERRLLAAEAAESCLEKKAARSASFAEKARQDRSEVPADHVKFVKKVACTAEV